MRKIKTFTVEYKDINGILGIDTVEAYSEFWAKAIFLTNNPLCTIISIK
jgi:hypothetical protein